jgi:hypothetical protein
MKEFVAAFIEEQEIRSIIYHSPDGPKPGYQWRLLLTFPATVTAIEKTEWTPWVFGTNRDVEMMLEQWKKYLATHGHLAHRKPPDGSAH